MKKKKDPKPSAGVDLAEIKRVLSFMAEHGLEELEYEHEGFHVRLRKSSSTPVYSLPAGASQPVVPPAASAAPQAFANPPAAQAASPAPSAAEDLHVIKSPIVGTFYGSPSPGAPAFVNAGDQIRVGQVLCIVEAMKLMNEIESDVEGELVRVMAQNGQPVEYGEPLFAVRLASKK